MLRPYEEILVEAMPSKKRRSLNTLLKKLRVEDKGWTKEHLARSAGLASQTVRNAENGLPISEVSMARIAKALGTTKDKLF